MKIEKNSILCLKILKLDIFSVSEGRREGERQD